MTPAPPCELYESKRRSWWGREQKSKRRTKD